jgi:L-ascorbate metabolism protein UlaG (beta-lactamase superfamily)
MIVTAIDETSLRLQSGETTIDIDPASARLKSDLIIRTSAPTVFASSPHDEIAYPGDYEIKDVEVRGWTSIPDSSPDRLANLFLIQWESISFGFFGGISNIPDAAALKEFSGVDLLFLPVGERFLSPEDAGKIVHQLEPVLVFPTHGKKPEALAKHLGKTATQADKFVFKKKDILGKNQEIVILSVK